MSVETGLQQKYPSVSDDILELMTESRRISDFFINLDIDDVEASSFNDIATVSKIVEALQRGDTRAAYVEVERVVEMY